MSFFLLFLFLPLSVLSSPVISLISLPFNSTHEFIPSSYIKYLESAGATTVRVPFTASDDEIRKFVDNSNGFFFQGGKPSLPASAVSAFNYVNEIQDNGVYYPMWGTCLGFQWLTQLIADDTSVLELGVFDSEDLLLPLRDVEDGSRMFRGAEGEEYMQVDMKRLFEGYNVTLNMHTDGINISTAERIEGYNILSVNEDRNGKAFVSAFEHETRPIYGAQFHPEKNGFEYGIDENGGPAEPASHSVQGVRASFELARFYVQEARKSGLRYDPESGIEMVFYSNDGIEPGSNHEETYLWKV
ncbi:hypothetical protein TrST_g12967 [Triparma strigata]|uniref:folate gamma-glutamyl hydrolase n=1 Tax=Triparma strigata TaxID=1606541 RepID=A0A9W7ERR5_9STRA|nr:hypothetical protein TrST_g12967 [Triparma strigata]